MKNTNKNEEKSQKKSSHFTYDDRVKLELLLSEAWSYKNIGKKINKVKSSISDEIRLNSVKGVYSAKKAHNKARQRRKQSKIQSMKIAIDAFLQDYIVSRIKQYWSPEDISGRIKFIDTNIPYVATDTIYKYLKSVYG